MTVLRLLERCIGDIEISGKRIEPEFVENSNQESDPEISTIKAMKKGWKPSCGLEDGLRETFEWYKKEYKGNALPPESVDESRQ